MELRYLKEFVVLADEGNYLKASEDLFISQSSLSKHIKSLEEEMNVLLFDRTTRVVKLTLEGEEFLGYARRIVLEDQNAKVAIRNCLETEGRALSLGVLPSLAEYNITDIIYSYFNKYPEVKVSLNSGDSTELKEKLTNGQIEVAFLRGKANITQFESALFMEDYLVAMVPNNNPLSKGNSIHINDLKGKDLIVMNKGSTVYQLCAEACHKLNFEMKVLYSDQHVSNLADFVIKGIGIALLMKGLTRFVRNPNARVIPVAPKIQGNLYLCWKKNGRLSSAAQRFIALVRNFDGKPDLANERILDFKPPLFEKKPRE